ncbi:MAG: reverse transcriptase domain-containing protein [Actinomycetota bacterium]|nr:reverse transcriptase domain-containing protein [Actinomycetota bacterium]
MVGDGMVVKARYVKQGDLRRSSEIFEKDFAEGSYGFRPGRGGKDALRVYLAQKVMEPMKEWTPKEGTPQGAVISPLLSSNIYLDPLDHLMARKGFKMVRYADDFVVLSKSEGEAEQAPGHITEWIGEEGLSLRPEKTCIVDAKQPGGFDFLGYHFERGYRWPKQESTKKLKDKVRAKTRRTNGQGLQNIISDVNQTLIGWFEYYKHSHKTTFPVLDSWIRVRLRSILRKRQGRKRRGRGLDHKR